MPSLAILVSAVLVLLCRQIHRCMIAILTIATYDSLQTVHSILFYFIILNVRVRFDMPY